MRNRLLGSPAVPIHRRSRGPTADFTLASGISDSQRRSEIAERTQKGLEEDLEDLRGQLGDDLEWYEGRIRTVAQRAPEWTSVDPSAVVDLFAIEDPELPEEGFLGPRMVAIGAETADEFVDKWIVAREEDPTVGERIEEFERDVREMLVFLEALAGRTGRRADRAHRILEEWMEANLAYLDELRENDLEALQDLVGEGALETGPDARAEKAQLWEEQRKRADELRAIWDDLHELVDDGRAYTYGGLDEVAALVHRACEGLAGAHAALRESGIVDQILEEDSKNGGAPDADDGREQWLRRPPEEDDEAGGSGAETELLEERPGDRRETEQLEARSEGESAPDGAETEEADADTDAAPKTEPMLDREMESPEGADSISERGSETEPAIDGGAGPESSAEAETEPAAVSQSETNGAELDPGPPTDVEARSAVAGPSNEEPDASARSGAGAPDEIPDVPDAPPEEIDGARSGEGPPATDGASREEVDREGDVASNSDHLAALDAAPEPLETKCLRIRTEWRAVGWPAIVAAFGPPVGFLAAMIGISAAELVGVEWAFNPVAVWSWAEAAIGVAVAWCFCTPMLLGWRPRWSGWEFCFVHEVELRDEASFDVDEHGFSLGRVSFAWEAIDAYRLRRWEAPDGDLIGWLMIVEPKYYESVQIIAAEDNRVRWQDSALSVVAPPRDAWQVDALPLERLRAHLRHRGVESTHSSEPPVTQ
jgi:hypothetical protein